MAEEPKLPPKYHVTLKALEAQKVSLSRELDFCIRGYNCHNKDRADDYMCTYACSMYDLWVEDYTGKVPVSQWQRQIADEAIKNAVSCWANYNLNSSSPTASYWQTRLRTALEQHTGKPLWSLRKIATPEGANVRPRVFVPTVQQDSSKSPLLVMAEAAMLAKSVAPPAPAKPIFATELRQLLEEANWTPEQAAEKVEIDWRTVYRHLSGEVFPNPKTRWAYQRALSERLKKKIELPRVR